VRGGREQNSDSRERNALVALLVSADSWTFLGIEDVETEEHSEP